MKKYGAFCLVIIVAVLMSSGTVAADQAIQHLQPVRTFEANGLWVTEVSFSRDDELLAASYNGTDIHVWNPTTREEISVLAEPLSTIKQLYKLVTRKPPPITTVDFAPKPPWNAGILAAGYTDGIRIWNARNGNLVKKRLPQSAQNHFEEVAFSPEGVFLGGATIDGKVFIWNTRYNKLMRRFQAHGPIDLPDTPTGLATDIERITFSPVPVGKYLATGTMEGEISVWNWKKALGSQKSLTDTEPFHVFTRSAVQPDVPNVIKSIGGLMLRGDSADSLTLIAGGTDGTIRVWSVPEGELLRELQVNVVHDLDLSPNGEILAVAQGEDLILKSLATGELLAKGQEHTNAIKTVSFSSSGKWIATGSGQVNPRERDDRVILWKNPFFEPGPPGKGDSPGSKKRPGKGKGPNP